MFSLRLLNISRSGALNQAVLLIKYRSVPWGLTEGGRSRGARSDKQKRRARSAEASMPEGGTHFEATDVVRNTALSCSCAGVRYHSCGPERSSSNWAYNRCAKLNDLATKKETCRAKHTY